MTQVRAAGAGAAGYDDELFLRASEQLRSVAAQPSAVRRALFVARRPSLVRDSVRAVRQLPALPLQVSRSTEGERLRQALGTRCLPRIGLLGRSVLLLPEDPAAYTRGRKRQALRTNLTKARSLGIGVGEVQEPGERRDALLASSRTTSDDAQHWLGWLRREFGVTVDRDRHFVAADASGRTLAVAVLTVDTEAALLRWHVRVDDSEPASLARYALMAHVAQTLAAERVRAFIVDSGLLLDPGLRYFQQRLGFQPMNVRLRPG